jgi:hypothetical protein
MERIAEMGNKGFIVKDSGKREEFNTGSRRDTQDNKPRFDLIPSGPLYRLAMVYSRGAKKYGDRNWEKGQPITRYMASAMRHLLAWSVGLQDEDHLAQAVWNIFAMMHTETMIEAKLYSEELDNRPGWQKPESSYNRIVQERYMKDATTVEEN